RRLTSPSGNVTVPVGGPAPGATTATVAVKVTAWPVTDDALTDDRRSSVVSARTTFTVSTAELLSAKLPVPAKEAVSALPMPSDTVRVAWPAALTGAVPSTVVPSRT